MFSHDAYMCTLISRGDLLGHEETPDLINQKVQIFMPVLMSLLEKLLIIQKVVENLVPVGFRKP